MTKFARALALAVVAGLAMTTFAVAAEKPEPAQKDKKEAPRGEVLKTVISATAEFDKDKKKLTINAVGQVPTGGWSGAKLTRKTKEAPKDGIYEYELTAVRPTGIVTQVISKVKASDVWENPPADLKGIKILGVGAGAKTVKVEK
jgi:hypothetical protein